MTAVALYEIPFDKWTLTAIGQHAMRIIMVGPAACTNAALTMPASKCIKYLQTFFENLGITTEILNVVGVYL